MIILPRGYPVRQKVNPARINLPEALAKLRVGTFTGDLRFDSAEGRGILLFQQGELVSVLFVNAAPEQRSIAYDALARIFEISIRGHALLNIYRFSAELVPYVHALLHGRYLHRGLNLARMNIKEQLEQIKDRQLDVCLRVYAQDQATLIWYQRGAALGFFHDGSTTLKTEADVTRSVAALPGACLDVVEIGAVDDLMLADLLASADLTPIWQRKREQILREQRAADSGKI